MSEIKILPSGRARIISDSVRPTWTDSSGTERQAECWDGDSWGRHAWMPEDEFHFEHEQTMTCLHCGAERAPAVNLDTPPPAAEHTEEEA